MKIFKLNTFNEIKDAYLKLKNVFPDLSLQVNINDYFKKIADNGFTYAIYNDVQICAIACIYINDFRTKTSFITLIGVHENYRRKGYAQALLDYCIKKSENAGMQYIKLEVNKNNFSAIKFYKKNQFKKFSEASKNSYYMIKEL